MQDHTYRWKAVVSCVCFCLSGFLALNYEICWIRKASLVFGTTTFALSTVLAVFFAGLGIGSFFLGRYAQRVARPLRVYAILEILVGILALLTPLWFAVADTVLGWLYPSIHHSLILLSLARFLLTTAMLLAPTVLMGGTLPLFCRQFVGDPNRMTRSIGFLYGINTLGAAIGCAVCGFLLIPKVGVNTTIYLAGILNVLIGLIVWPLGSSVPLASDDSATQEPSAAIATREFRESGRGLMIIRGLFFLIGFVAIGNEIIWTRYLSLLIYNTVYTYTLTLCLMLAGIVIGSVIAALIADRLKRHAMVLGGIQMAIGIVVLSILTLPATTWSQWRDAEELSTQTCVVAMVLLVPAVLSGISFPLAIRMVVRHPTKAAGGVGHMSALNIAGGIAGSLFVGFVALPAWGLAAALLANTAISVLIGVTA